MKPHTVLCTALMLATCAGAVAASDDSTIVVGEVACPQRDVAVGDLRVRIKQSGADTIPSTSVARTDDHGQFRFTAVPEANYQFEVIGLKQQGMHAEGQWEAPRNLRTAPQPVVKLILDRLFSLQGRVVDGGGEPVGDVWVRITRSSDDGAGREHHREITNDRGMFNFTRIARPGSYELTASSRSHHLADARVVKVGRSSEAVAVTVARKRALHVQLKVADGELPRPIDGRISIWARRTAERTELGPDGSVSLDPLPTGQYQFSLLGPIASAVRVVGEAQFWIEPDATGSPARIDIPVEVRPVVRVRAVSDRTDRPVAEAGVLASDGDEAVRATTDERGVADLGLGPGQWTIAVQAAGHQPARTTVADPLDGRSIALRLVETPTCTVTVRSAAGDPVAKTSVRLMVMREGQLVTRPGIADASGLMSFKCDQQAQPALLCVSHPDHAPQAKWITLAPDKSHDVRLADGRAVELRADLSALPDSHRMFLFIADTKTHAPLLADVSGPLGRSGSWSGRAEPGEHLVTAVDDRLQWWILGRFAIPEGSGKFIASLDEAQVSEPRGPFTTTEFFATLTERLREVNLTP